MSGDRYSSLNPYARELFEGAKDPGRERAEPQEVNLGTVPERRTGREHDPKCFEEDMFKLEVRDLRRRYGHRDSYIPALQAELDEVRKRKADDSGG
jgi:hypothetical protein